MARNVVLKQYDFVKLDNDLPVVDPMDSTVVAVIPRKFPKEQATQGTAATALVAAVTKKRSVNAGGNSLCS